MTYLYIIAFCIIWINNKPKIALFNRKPFNCELCMAFWITLIYQALTSKDIGFSFLVALTAPLALKAYEKINIWMLK